MNTTTLLDFIGTPAGLTVIFLATIAFFILIWFGLRRFILKLNFLRTPIVRRVAQILSSVGILILTFTDQDSDGIFYKFTDRFIPEFLITPLLLFFMFCLLITLFPNKTDPPKHAQPSNHA